MDEKGARAIIVKMFELGESVAGISGKTGVCRRKIYRILARYRELGSLENRKKPGRPRTVNVRAVREKLRKRIKRNNSKSIRQLAKDVNISEYSARNIIHNELNLKSYKYQSCHMLSQANMRERTKKCKKMLELTKGAPLSTILFSDEKIFSVEPPHNHQNDRQLMPPGSSSKGLLQKHPHSHFPKSVMVWGGICSSGKTPLVFIDKSVKINARFYQDHILREVVEPWGREHFGGGDWVFQQDWAPAHGAKSTLRLCEEIFPHFWDKEVWPPCSPDLNPLDFSVWSILESKVPAKDRTSIPALKSALLRAWDQITVETLAAIVSEFRLRLKRCIKARGGYFE